ncbi:hypothetical protein CDAR_302701 [Caerostris darwini]|uniref:Uncharacterized protein n=1 Tax=Caerostris darwini TaxID=1538125 RepID=A0AAV4V413_9ARAC|nr:hypothetical protein CDAR_302701 [Caerostris darwini]
MRSERTKIPNPENHNEIHQHQNTSSQPRNLEQLRTLGEKNSHPFFILPFPFFFLYPFHLFVGTAISNTLIRNALASKRGRKVVDALQSLPVGSYSLD